MACCFSELVVDCRDPEALAAFWAAVLGYRVLGREGDGAVEIGPEAGFGGAAPTLVFGLVADPTPGKLRLHIDVNPPTATRTRSSSGCWASAPRAPMSDSTATRDGTCSPTRRATSSACWGAGCPRSGPG
jgi:catechol 2,3-dioxygenase-like lactoylglutathione lyase family enzyme